MFEIEATALARAGLADRPFVTKPMMPHLARMAASYVKDRTFRPSARRIGEVPWSIDAITPEWLTQVLCARAPGLRVATHAVSVRSAGSTARGRIELNYAGGDPAAHRLPGSLFAKSSPTLQNRFALGLMDTPRTEAMFYARMRPRLSLEAPVGYFCDYDPATGRSIQLMEDLVQTRQATFCSPTTLIDRPKAEQVVRLLAGFHAMNYGAPDLAAQYPWVMTYRQFFEGGHVRFGLEKYHDRSLRKVADLLPPDLREQAAGIWQAKAASIVDHEGLPQTVLHGDVHLGNWYVTGHGNMGLCDWQCLAIGTYAQDLAYAMTTMLRIEDRRAWERDLLGIYVDAFNRQSARPITADDCWHLYRRQGHAGLMMWTVTLSHPPLLPDMQPEETSLELLRRTAAAMSDLGTMSFWT